MQAYHFSGFLFVIVVPLVSALAALASSAFDVPTSGARDPESSTAPRLLRADNSRNGIDEDRTIPSVGDFANLVRVALAPRNAYEKYIASHDSPSRAFKKLDLGHFAIFKDGKIQKKQVVRYFSSQRFKAWAKHFVNMEVNKPDPYDTMFVHLKDTFGDYNFYHMINILIDARSTRELGEKLGEAQRNFYALDDNGRKYAKIIELTKEMKAS